jgi:invasion protein IalB
MEKQNFSIGRTMWRSGAVVLLTGGLCMPAAAQGGSAVSGADEAPAAAPAKSARTETVRQGSWTLTCKETDAVPPERSCSATVRVTQQPKRDVVLVWEITRAPDATVRSLMQTQTGVSVKPGVELQLGKTTVATFNYVICGPRNCEATGAIDGALRRKLQNTKEVTVLIRARDGRDVRYRFPIDGIDKVFAAMGG